MCEKCKELIMCPVGEKRKMDEDFYCGYGERRADNAATHGHNNLYSCSDCLKECLKPHCPNCGAKMDLEVTK